MAAEAEEEGVVGRSGKPGRGREVVVAEPRGRHGG
jgi:hypothetical protein